MKKGLIRRLSALLFIALLIPVLAGCPAKQQTLGSSTNVEQLLKDGIALYQGSRNEEAEAVFRKIMEDHPYSKYTLEAQLLLADLLYRTEMFDDSASYYASFVAMHPSHPKAPYALFQKGMSNFKEVLSVDRDQKSTRKALFAFEDLTDTYPDSPYADKTGEFVGFLKERLAGREFYVGNYYFKEGNYRGALARFGEVIRSYPDASIVDKTLYYIVLTYDNLGEEDLAREVLATLTTEYPHSPYLAKARAAIGG